MWCGRAKRMMRHDRKFLIKNSRGFQVKLSLQNTARVLVAIAFLLLAVTRMAPAQTPPPSWATLDAPPTGIVPAGDVLRAGHLGREIADEEDISHFYHDLIGLEIRGTRDQPRPFSQHHGLQEFVDIGQGVPNPYDSMSRVVLLPIPGTAAAPGGPEMTIEAIEIRGIKSAPFHVALRDPGASYLTIFVRDLDKTLALLKDERYPVITAGGSPVELPSWPGLTGKIRAVFVRDPDGTPVELVELSPAPASTAAADSKVLPPPSPPAACAPAWTDVVTAACAAAGASAIADRSAPVAPSAVTVHTSKRASRLANRIFIASPLFVGLRIGVRLHGRDLPTPLLARHVQFVGERVARATRVLRLHGRQHGAAFGCPVQPL